MYKVFFSAILLLAVELYAHSMRTITFASTDGLTVTADYYPLKDAPLIILFHQAGWSRGAYREIAPKLNRLGFACLAVDQRSDDRVKGIINQTHQRAYTKGLPTGFPEALKDMQAALDYAVKTLKPRKILIWGSSYSAALVFVLAARNPKTVSAILAFSPGEYFTPFGKSGHYVKDHAQKIHIPVFITSAKKEHHKALEIFNVVPAENKRIFAPDGEGQHGSRALWSKFPDHRAYWKSVKSFILPLR